MKKNVLVFGLISGGIVSLLMIVLTTIFCGNDNYDGSMLIGYASMILSFSFVFVGVKNFRDKHNAGLIGFGKAFWVGLLITLISSTMYVITWIIVYKTMMPDFMEKYAAHMIEEAQKSGASAEQIAAQASEMAMYSEMYKNPLFIILLTYAEILPVGLIVSLITALILKRKAK